MQQRKSEDANGGDEDEGADEGADGSGWVSYPCGYRGKRYD